MRCSFPTAVAILACGFLGAQAADPRGSAEAALALAKAKYADPKHQPQPLARAECHTDLASAKADALKQDKQLVLWVGMTCEAIPEIRDGLSACVHCHVDSYNGSATPRLCVPVEGGAWCFPRTDLGTTYDAASVRAVLGKAIPLTSPVQQQSASPVIVLPQQHQDCPTGVCPKAQPAPVRFLK